MDIERHQSDEETMLVVSGRVDATTAPKLQSELLSAAKDPQQLAVDFSAVSYLSSAGLRALLLGARALAEDDRRLTVYRASDDVLDVIRLTGFDKVLTLAEPGGSAT